MSFQGYFPVNAGMGILDTVNRQSAPIPYPPSFTFSNTNMPMYFSYYPYAYGYAGQMFSDRALFTGRAHNLPDNNQRDPQQQIARGVGLQSNQNIAAPHPFAPYYNNFTSNHQNFPELRGRYFQLEDVPEAPSDINEVIPPAGPLVITKDLDFVYKEEKVVEVTHEMVKKVTRRLNFDDTDSVSHIRREREVDEQAKPEIWRPYLP